MMKTTRQVKRLSSERLKYVGNKEFVKIVVRKSPSPSPCGYQGNKLSTVLNHRPNASSLERGTGSAVA